MSLILVVNNANAPGNSVADDCSGDLNTVVGENLNPVVVFDTYLGGIFVVKRAT